MTNLMSTAPTVAVLLKVFLLPIVSPSLTSECKDKLSTLMVPYEVILEKSNANSTEKRLKKARSKMDELKSLLRIEIDGDTALEAAIRVINYANSLNFFDKGKNIEIYAAAAYYMTLRFMKVQSYFIFSNHTY